jgi:hypothetical protein
MFGAVVNYQSPVATRVGQLLRLALSTDKDGEALSALAATRRTLAANGLDHHTLAAAVETGLRAPAVADPAEPYRPRQERHEHQARDWRAEVKFCHRHRDQLFGSEHGLIDTLLKWQGMPTPKQLDWLGRIIERMRAN